MLNVIMWLLNGKIRSKVVNNIESEEHSEQLKKNTCRKYCRLRVINSIKVWVGRGRFSKLNLGLGSQKVGNLWVIVSKSAGANK